MEIDQTTFINLYIQRLVKEVEELVKSKILLETKETYKTNTIDELNKKIGELEQASIKDREEVVQTWKTALAEKDQEVTRLQLTVKDLRKNLEIKENTLTTYVTKINEHHRQIASKDEQIRILNEKVEEQAKASEAKVIKKKTKKGANSSVEIKPLI